MQDSNAVGVLSKVAVLAGVLCVGWLLLTGDCWQFVPVALALVVGCLAARAAGSRGRNNGRGPGRGRRTKRGG